MAKRADELIIDSLAHEWDATHAPAAGTTCTATSGAAASNTEKVHLSQLGWSIRNAGGAAFTATLSVRDTSIAGTVKASWDIVVAAAGSAQDTYALSLMGTRGNPLVVEFGTPASSVTQKVSIAGWRNQSAS